MTIEQIIVSLKNPATITEALKEIATLPFRGNERFLFEQKQQKFFAGGMSDYDKLQWMSEMKAFLQTFQHIHKANKEDMPDKPKQAGSTTDIFVSYSHEDEQRVRPIVRCLEQQGWQVFWDRTIPMGLFAKVCKRS